MTLLEIVRESGDGSWDNPLPEVDNKTSKNNNSIHLAETMLISSYILYLSVISTKEGDDLC